MADFVSHPLGRASAELVLLSKSHEYLRWRDHTTTYSEFKKEMLGSNRSATDGVPQNDHAVAGPALVDQLQPQPHTIREEPFSGDDDHWGRRSYEGRRQD
jgi:hypothetical protein